MVKMDKVIKVYLLYIQGDDWILECDGIKNGTPF